MRSVRAWMIIPASIGGSNIGCGSDAPMTSLNPVHGKVCTKGEPASSAVVSLQAEGAAPQTMQGNPIVPIGVASEDGTFKIACDGLGEGAPAGKYKVLTVRRPSEGTPDAKFLLAKKRGSSNDVTNALMPADPFTTANLSFTPS